jgi:hypothetical protein
LGNSDGFKGVLTGDGLKNEQLQWHMSGAPGGQIMLWFVTKDPQTRLMIKFAFALALQ